MNASALEALSPHAALAESVRVCLGALLGRVSRP